MKDIHTYRNWNGEGKALNPKLADVELPQLIDLVANAYGRLNAINMELLDTPTLHALCFQSTICAQPCGNLTSI